MFYFQSMPLQVDESFAQRPQAQTPRDLIQSREEARERASEAREEAMARREEVKEEFEERSQAAREEAKNRQEEFRQRLQEIRDEQKARLAERLSENINRINQKWVDHWLKVLDRLSQVLAKMETRADKLDELGHDTEEARANIEAANEEIAQTQEALNDQAAKVYTVEFTDESNLGEGIRTTIEELRSDLSETRQAVQEAILATKDALSSLKGTDGEEEIEEEEEDEEEEQEEATEEADLAE